jgi:hypothetical protein
MAQGGLFITLYDEETLQLYLDRGIYGQHMSPEAGEPSSYSNHYPTLADYACGREGNHVFFFRDREIFYGGQLVGSEEHGAFFINGQQSPLGRDANAPLVWDESERDRYDRVDSGLFTVADEDDEDDAVCQPFLLRFEDEGDLAGTYITSDQLYFELGEYPYPLPSNTISGMGFCTLTPGETRTMLELLENEAEGHIEPESAEDVELQGEPVPYSPEYGVGRPEDANPESHLEAAVTANPSLLPESLRPDGAAICRQVPISPFKPRNMDEADVCYFTDDSVRNGTMPNTVIELKNKRAGKGAATQVVRYLRWLQERLGAEADEVDVYVYAPSFTGPFDSYVPQEFTDQIQKVDFIGDRSTLSDQ